MDFFSNALLIALPVFIVLIFIEMIVAKIQNKNVMNSMDTVSSLSSGITNTLFKILGLTIYLVSYDFLLKHFSYFKIEYTVIQYIIGFLTIDFYVYWWHRWRHEYNVLWNEHVIHHSSEEYNLPVALRQTIADFVNPAFFLLFPAALFGVSFEVITVIGVVMLFGGFWYHTELIGKMGFMEKIIVTPSHHKIHHAINPEYIDKNYGGILIIWDRLFGTFQEELPNVKPVYGITRQVSTWNPIKINFLHITLLVKDAWRTSNTWDKFRIWFKPTGWRPADVAEKYPIPYIKDVYKQEKYSPASGIYLKVWSWTQLVITFLIMIHFITLLASVERTTVFIYAFFIFLTVYSYTSLMDRSRYAWLIELMRLCYALAVIQFYDEWFSIDSVIPYGTIIITIYFIGSFLISCAFEYFEFKTDSRQIELSI